MKLVKMNVMAHEVEFFCDSHNTRNGFAHDVTLFVDGHNHGTAHVYWCNRTWESWIYQSACLAACSQAIDRDSRWIRDNYKYEHKLSRIVGEKRKAEVAELVANDDNIMLYRAIKRNLTDNCY